MGHCLQLNLLLHTGRYTVYSDESVKAKVENLERLAEKDQNLTERQKNHVRAVVKFAHGDCFGALEIWDKIILDHPTDMHAILSAYTACIHLGLFKQIKDIIARVLPFWQSTSFSF